MYFDEPADIHDIKLVGAGAEMRFALSLNGLAIIFFGLIPDSIMNACLVAITRTLAS